MGRKPKSHKPSFFKVLVKDYSTILRLPPVFVKKYGKFLRESSNVRTSSEETWVVKLEERSYDDEKYWFFTKGWNKFVNDLDLKFGEFLVFWFNAGDSSFDVSAYGTNCCEREIIDSNADQVFEFKNDNCHNLPEIAQQSLPFRSCTPDQGDAGSHPRFERLLNESRISRVRLPCKFLQRYREHLPKHVKLRINSGAAWVVKLEASDEEYCFCEGWSKFVEDLDLETSELLMLRFNVENATFDVSVYGKDWVERGIPIMAVDSDTDHEDFGFNVDSCNIPGSTFDVSVYGKNYCGREISTMEVDIGDDDLINDNVPLKGRTIELQRKIVSGERNYGSIEEIKSFSKLLKKQQRGSFMDIPKAFAIETGIANRRVIKLQNEKGMEWRVELPMLKDGRTRIGKGWNDFIVDNKLVFGSTCWFEFDASSGNLIVKQEVDLTKTSPSKRRGRERGRSGKGGIVPIESGNRRQESVVVPTKRGRPKNMTVPMKRGRGYVYRVNY